MPFRAPRFLHLFVLFLTLPHVICCAQQQERRAVVGAIRWDAWHGNRSDVGKAVERSLGPKKWHVRLPVFAKVLGENEVRIDGASQEVVDREIKYARTGRLDYWAFLLYPEGSQMNLGLQYYLSSAHKRGLRFCVMLEQARWKTSESAAKSFQHVADLMARPEYQVVAGDRPLLYVLAAKPDSETWGARQPRNALDQLRAAVRVAGKGDPYVVILDFRTERSSALREKANADAVGAYAYQRDGKDAPYAQLAHEAEHFWDECKNTGSAVVPIVMTGWDRRPRVEQPVFWETWQVPNVGIEKFYRAPTALELSQHLRNALTWVKTHPRAAPANAILIYAWNENDEGGWLVPTLKEGSWRVQAVGKALRQN